FTRKSPPQAQHRPRGRYMPGTQLRTVMTASGTSTPLLGTQYETAPFNAFVEIAMQTDATGVLATVDSGMDVLQEEGPVQLGTINVQPKYPDDYYLNDVIGQGEKLKINLRDTSGAIRTVMLTVKYTPL